MSVPRKVSLTSLVPSFSLNKEDDSKVKALRFEIDMFKNFKNEICQVNYKELVSPALKKNQTYEKTGNGSFRHISTSGDEDYPLKVAKKRKLQSGPRKGPKNKRTYDFINIGEGYDETDPFIDNSDAYDPYVPPNLVPIHGEFYVNSGRLKFKSVEGSEPERASDEPAIKKSRINSCSGESDSNEEEEYRKNNKVKKEHDEKDSMWKSTEESWSYGTYGTLWCMEYLGDTLEFSKINEEEAKQLEIPKTKVVLDTKPQKDSVADAIESVVNAVVLEIKPTIGKSNPSKTLGILATEQTKSKSKMCNSSAEEEEVDRSREQREGDKKTQKTTINSNADEIESAVNAGVLEIEPTFGKSNPCKIPGTLATKERKSKSKMCNSSVEEEEEEEVDRSNDQREGDTKTQKTTIDSVTGAIESVVNAAMSEIEPTIGKATSSKTPGVLATEERKSKSKMCNFFVEEEEEVDRSREHRDGDTKTQKTTKDSIADEIESVVNAAMSEIEPTIGKSNPSKTPGVLATEERKSKSKICNLSVEEEEVDRSTEHRDGDTKTQKPTTDSVADAIESSINAVVLESKIPGTLATEERKSKSKMSNFSVEEEVDRFREQSEGKESLLLAQIDFYIGRTIKWETLPSELIFAIEFLQQRAVEFTDEVSRSFLPGFFCPDFVYDVTISCHSIITSESKHTTKDRRKDNEHLLAILTS
ncbi:hypothetical protein QYM36_017007 [Artemia franciscana]|uniref:Hpc2-related domain-containing protein n=1 Tax=Artemia franciscana TaxID=6661 RepID=A0AA88HGF8_ARTSF|nr:hypothetical protein QYM36_017007 [Artemia franciscana]